MRHMRKRLLVSLSLVLLALAHALPIPWLHATADSKVVAPPRAQQMVDLRSDVARFRPLPSLFVASFRYADFDGAWVYDYANRKTAVSYFTRLSADEMLQQAYVFDYLLGWEKLFRFRSRASLNSEPHLSAMQLAVAAASGSFASEHCEQFDLAPPFSRMWAPDSALKLSRVSIDTEGAGFIEAESELSDFLVSLRGESSPWLYTQTTFGHNGTLFAVKLDSREWRFVDVISDSAALKREPVKRTLIQSLQPPKAACSYAGSLPADVATELQVYLPFLLSAPESADHAKQSSSTGAGGKPTTTPAGTTTAKTSSKSSKSTGKIGKT